MISLNDQAASKTKITYNCNKILDFLCFLSTAQISTFGFPPQQFYNGAVTITSLSQTHIPSKVVVSLRCSDQFHAGNCGHFYCYNLSETKKNLNISHSNTCNEELLSLISFFMQAKKKYMYNINK